MAGDLRQGPPRSVGGLVLVAWGRSLLSFLPRALLLPPVNLLLVALLCWALAHRYPRTAHRLLGLCLLGLLVTALPVVPHLLFAPLEAGIRLDAPGEGPRPLPAAIVILSGDTGFGEAEGAITAGAQVGGLTLERMRAGALLQRRSDLPILVTGGIVRIGSPSLADMMAQTLAAEFDTKVRWIEPRSKDTWENAQFSAALLAREGITSVYLVTHPWHLRRAMMAFAHFGITVWPAPTSRDTFAALQWGDFLPSADAWLDSYYAFHEWIGCAVYALRR